ncbi:MAG: GrpB family protein [Chloroflexi bacterium]|nr:GrpB family protein [Chloroflexota bacterium]
MSDASLWSPLGTDGGHVEIVEYRLEWAEIFECERAAILARCSPWVMEVHHFGSTSVPGLAAKPILDIMPVVDNPSDGECAVGPMTTLGYRYRGENELPGRFYFDKIVGGRTVVHCHMYPQDHSDVRKLVAFRDRLRTHRETAFDYERLKRELASKHRDDRVAYTDGKGEFIRETTDLALADTQDGQEEER